MKIIKVSDEVAKEIINPDYDYTIIEGYLCKLNKGQTYVYQKGKELKIIAFCYEPGDSRKVKFVVMREQDCEGLDIDGDCSDEASLPDNVICCDKEFSSKAEARAARA